MERNRKLSEVTEEHKSVQMHEFHNREYLPAINALYDNKVTGRYNFFEKNGEFVVGLLLVPNEEVYLDE